MKEGWICIYRAIEEDPMYFAEPFTRMQAFIDLILITNHERTVFFKRGIKITVERGQTVRSEDELALRWKWSRGKVRRFLLELENDTKIVQQKTRLCNCISIVNYDKYRQTYTKRFPIKRIGRHVVKRSKHDINHHYKNTVLISRTYCKADKRRNVVQPQHRYGTFFKTVSRNL